MDDEKVPMTNVIAKISHKASFLFNILESIFGVTTVIFIYKIFKEQDMINYYKNQWRNRK